MIIQSLLVLFLLSCALCLTPIVTLHGIGDDLTAVDGIVSMIRNHYNSSVYVHNAEIGNGFWNSFNLGMWKQVDLLHQALSSDPLLKDGFHALAHSQGTLIMRGYIEKYNDPPVITFSALTGPQNGQSGVPRSGILNKLISSMIEKLMYTEYIQNSFSFAQYWKDSFRTDLYLQHSKYLVELNNEVTFNPMYRENILKLKKYISLWSPADEVIIPPSSGMFNCFAPNSRTNITHHSETELFKKDLIGLRTLKEDGRLVFVEVEDVKHNDWKEEGKVLPVLQKFVFAEWKKLEK
ncbi:hypothetical protein RCL1_001076 [Eukaryota sp. TZLM3-RCL]